MNPRVDTANRLALTLLGVLLLVTGGLGLALSFRAFGNTPPLLPRGMRDFARDQPWFWWAVAAACLLVALLALWWLIAQLRVDRATRLDLTTDDRDGLTVVHSSALTDAVENEAEALRGVGGASAQLREVRGRRLSLAVELNERAHQGGLLFRGAAIITLEQGSRLCRHVGAAGRQVRILRIAEILHAFLSVAEVRALDVAAAAMTRGGRTKRPVGFADRVEPLPRSATVGTRRVHGKVAGVLDDACGHLLQIKRARPLQHHLGDLTLAFANMAPQPGRNVGRLLRCKGRRRPPNGNCAGETKAVDKMHS